MKEACECKQCDIVWYNKPRETANIWSLFDESAIGRMIFCKNITISTFMELFDLSSASSGDVTYLEDMIYMLQNQLYFNIVCEDTGELISPYHLSGGADICSKKKAKRKRKPCIGRRLKKPKINTLDEVDKNNKAVDAKEASDIDELADCDTKPGNSDCAPEGHTNIDANSAEAERLERHRLAQ